MRNQTYDYVLVSLELAYHGREELFNGLSDIHSYIRDPVLCERNQNRDKLSPDGVDCGGLCKGSYSEEWGQPVQVVLVSVESYEARDCIATCPLRTKNLRKLFEILYGCFSYREYGILKPGNADRVELIVEESFSKLTCQDWELLYNA